MNRQRSRAHVRPTRTNHALGAVVAVLLALSLTACGSDETDTADQPSRNNVGQGRSSGDNADRQ